MKGFESLTKKPGFYPVGNQKPSKAFNRFRIMVLKDDLYVEWFSLESSLKGRLVRKSGIKSVSK